MKRLNQPVVVLMTATIEPGHYTYLLQCPNTTKRLEEYSNSLKFWTELEDDRIQGIVFCENSGSDLSHLQKKYNNPSNSLRPIEWLSFAGNKSPDNVHYGYSELEIIDFACVNSSLIRETPRFIKVTGRLTFPEITRLLDSFDNKLEFCADCNRTYKKKFKAPIKTRTQLMYFHANFYRKHFYGKRDQMLDNFFYIEDFVASIAWTLRKEPNTHLRFPHECHPVGIGASNGDVYNKGKSHLKSQLRGILRKIFPFWWI